MTGRTRPPYLYSCKASDFLRQLRAASEDPAFRDMREPGTPGGDKDLAELLAAYRLMFPAVAGSWAYPDRYRK